ncbi:aminotransferase class I/II-fold pyridoxal phosphate-dependent enzyme [Chitinophaga filiformis]|uniref:pyridoxal phosphate-dependent aminotransferase n=1 Tax=Chitinophaga filiformis TaxID=104663 RepID=UPI001F3A7C07|nr:aminotransferase class I/II-fold pyridoxal phosphate-dependent enzyme [Chitinophaga filiformis]MCF6405198.1 aminotransferase class I/II-fold pyridoxal phosphate-dependent enzyme [Chitinophaga filiformis]
MIHGHGDDRYLFNYNIVADFSSNVYYGGWATGLQQHLTTCLQKVRNYPEANAQRLQAALAEWHSLTPGQILVTNGATEAFYLVAHAFRGKSATIVIPAFAEYEDACRANDLGINYLHWDDLQPDTVFDTDIVFFGNPNNPTGAVLHPATIKQLLEHHSKTMFVIDEAYVDFTVDIISMIPTLDQYPNLIIIKSLTKTYSIPGLRLGYILSSEAVINNILPYKMPWSVNALAIEAGLFIAGHRQEIILPTADLTWEAFHLIGALRAIGNISIRHTHTNFFLCETDKGTAAALKQFLLQTAGLLIRDASNFRSLTPQHFRIAAQRREQNVLLVKGIRAWMESF